tara:strand:- start:3712 stop:4062 length:351 start_codon:yes stop_codon:yes gene_type:complete
MDTHIEDVLMIERMDKMHELFPKLKFCADETHLDILDDVLVKSKDAVVYYTHDNYYYSNFTNKPIEIIYIKKDKFITYRDFYLECEKSWLNNCGDHCFLEGISIRNDTQIDLYFGS